MKVWVSPTSMLVCLTDDAEDKRTQFYDRVLPRFETMEIMEQHLLYKFVIPTAYTFKFKGYIDSPEELIELLPEYFI